MKDGLKAGTFTEVSSGARRTGRGARQPAQQVLQAALVRALLHMRCADESRYYCTALVVKYGITTRHSAR